MWTWAWDNDRSLASHLKVVAAEIAARSSDRKVRLFGAACCRLIWERLTDDRLRAAVEVAERLADGGVGDESRSQARLDADAVLGRDARGRPRITDRPILDTVYAIDGLLADPAAAGIEDVVTYTAEPWQDRVPHVAVFRDVFGNPFRPVAFDPGWRTSTAVAMARGMYDGRDFAAMPVLADALEDAGCGHPEVLAHCRDPAGVHVRGCWVVDGLLGLS